MGHRVRCYCNFVIARDRRIPHCSCLAVCYCDKVCQERHWYQEHRWDCKYDALVRTQLGRDLPKEIYRGIFKYVETMQRQPNWAASSESFPTIGRPASLDAEGQRA